MKPTCRWLMLLALALGLAAAPPAHAQKAEDRQADDQYSFATELFGKKLYELAIQQYEKFVADYPNHSNVDRARIRIGESYLRLNQNQRAVEVYSKALAERPESNFRLEVLVGLGLAQFNLQNYPRAVEAFTDAQAMAVQANDKNLGPIAANWLGESLFHSERYQDAISAYQGVARWPGSNLAPQAQYSIGFCQAKLGQEEAAAATWEQVVEQFPNSDVAPEADYRAGDILLRAKRLPAAEQRFQHTLEKYRDSPFGPQAQMGLGWVAFQRKDFKTALAAFEGVGVLAPKTDLARQAALRAADCCFYMQDFRGAASRYEAIAAGDDAIAREAGYWLGVSRIQSGDPKGAAEVLGRLASDAKDPAAALRARLRLADLQLDTGETEAAAESYRIVTSQAPAGDGAVLDQAAYGRGVALYRLRKFGEAEGQFAAVLEHGRKSPTSTLAAIGVAQCRLDSGRPKDAAATLAELLKEELPAESRATALYLLGMARIQANEPAEREAAIAALKEVIEQQGDSREAAPAAAALVSLYLDMKREDEAATVAELVIRKYANHPAATGALLAVADAQRQAQKFSAAVEMYQKVLAGTPDARTAAAAHAGLALCYASGQAPDIERANRELDSMTDDGSQPGYRARIRYMVALDYERAQRLAEAYQQYQAALGAQPGEEIGALAALRSGIVLVAQGKRTESIAAFQVVIQTYPKAIVVPDALYEMAWGFIDSGRKSDAAPLFERLEKEFPEHPFGVDASFRLAEDDFGQKRYAQAAERYQRVAQSPQAGPLADKSLYKLGWCQREMKDMVASGRAFATLLSRYEKSALAPESKLRLAEALIAQGDNSRAAGLLAELLGRKAADDIERRLEAQARVALAGIQLGQGDPGAAYQTAQPAASTQFQSVGMRAQLLCAEARFAQKQYREALTDYLKVITIYPRVDDLTGQALYRVGECSDQLGQRDQAAEYWREVVKSYPGTEWARRAGERLGK